MSTLTATLVVLLCLASSACAAAATAASVAPTPPLQLREAFNERAKAFLSDVVENDRSHDTYAELTRLALGKEGVTGAGMQSSFAKMWARQDCSDFDVSGMIRLLWQHGDSPLLPPALKDNITQALLHWQYWIDEANIAGGYFQGDMMFWTENLQMSFHSSEYMAGALFPNTLFPGTNMTGREHWAKGKQFVLNWLERRYRWGFSEWKSETYYQFDLQNLANLVAVAPDPEVRVRAEMVLDLIIFDVGVHTHQGMMASSRGRSYGSKKFNISHQSTAPLASLLTGEGLHGFAGLGTNGAAIAIALTHLNSSVPYVVPDVVLMAANDKRDEFENWELLSISPFNVEAANATGLGYTTPDDGIVWWGEFAYAHPATINEAFIMGEAWQLFDSNETTFHIFKAFLPIYKYSKDLPPLISALLWPMTVGSVLGPVVSYIHKTPDVTLGSALDYHKAGLAPQQQLWQATINGSVVVFTTAPGPNFAKPGPLQPPTLLRGNAATPSSKAARARSEAVADATMWERRAGELLKAALASNDTRAVEVKAVLEALDGDTERVWGDLVAAVATVLQGLPSYNCSNPDYSDGCWTGSAYMPRIGQYKNVLLALYKPPYGGFPEFLFPPRSHAYFPRDLFDEVEIDHLTTQGWVFGRAGDGYIALYTSGYSIAKWLPVEAQPGGWEIFVDGEAQSAWICVTGRAAVDGTFSDFVTTLLNSTVRFVANKDDVNASLTIPSAPPSSNLNGLSLAFGWNSPLTAHGGAAGSGAAWDVPLSGDDGLLPPYGRFENPYIKAQFPAERLNMAQNGTALLLDYTAGTRQLVQAGVSARSVSDIATAVATRCVAEWGPHDNFLSYNFDSWGYEGGVIQQGLREIAATPGLLSEETATEILAAADARLDYFASTPGQFGYELLHNETIFLPWIYSVGDRLGLFPIAYATRARLSHDAGTARPNSSDTALVEAVASQYIMKYPHRLSDGTFSRPIDWLADGFFSLDFKAIWVDDSFMGTGVLVAASQLLGDAAYLDEAVLQLLNFDRHLRDISDGLYWHGYDNGTDRYSCCKWGRGNGWALVAKADALEVMKAQGLEHSTSFQQLLAAFQAHSNGFLAAQSPLDGRWHNVMTEPDSFLETSVTAMAIIAFSKGLLHGWLPQPFSAALQQAWRALAATIAGDGGVVGVVGEMGIQDCAAQYDKPDTGYARSAPGLGAVLRAVAAYRHWQADQQ